MFAKSPAYQFWKYLPPGGFLSESVQVFNNEFNMTEYQDDIFAKAGVTADEFFLQGEIGEAYMANLSQNIDNPPLMERTHIGLRNFLGADDCNYALGRAMLTSPYVKRVMDTIRENPPPMDIWQQYEENLAMCDPEGKLSQPSWAGLYGPSEPGVLGSAGFGLSAGAGLGGGVKFFFAFPSGGPFFFINVVGGILAGIDAGVDASLGMMFTGETNDIEGLGFSLDLTIPTPVVGPGLSVGLDLDGVWDLQFWLNVGAGISIGGFNVGYTWQTIA